MDSNLEIQTIPPEDKLFDQTQTQQLRELRVSRLCAIGNINLLAAKKIGLLCSSKCPGKLILRTHDLMRSLRGEQIAVMSGFHSPIEKECLNILMRRGSPVIVCPARSLSTMRVPSAWKVPLERGKLLILSPFSDSSRRPTTRLTARRNRVVAALADKVFIPYAAPNSGTFEFARELRDSGKSTFTLDVHENSALFDLGARSISSVQELM